MPVVSHRASMWGYTLLPLVSSVHWVSSWHRDWNWCYSSSLHYYLYTPCCSSRNPETSLVTNNPALLYQRTRGENPGRVILSRNSHSTTTGLFHCDIPDVNGVIQSFYVGIYDNSTGESCILSEWLVICKEASSTPDKDSTFSTAYHLCSTYHTSGTPCARGGIIMFNIHKGQFNLVGSNI